MCEAGSVRLVEVDTKRALTSTHFFTSRIVGWRGLYILYIVLVLSSMRNSSSARLNSSSTDVFPFAVNVPRKDSRVFRFTHLRAQCARWTQRNRSAKPHSRCAALAQARAPELAANR